MDIKTLCLGVLSLGEASGYEIKKFFEDGFSHFYVAGFGSIYPALAQLSHEGHVTCCDVEQQGRPHKKVYRIAESGRALFLEELARLAPGHRVRSDFLLLMVFAEFLTGQRLQEVVQQRSADLQAELDYIEACREREGLSAGALFALGYAQAVQRAGLDYLRDHRHTLRLQSKEEDK